MKGDAPFSSARAGRILLDTMWAGAGGPPNPRCWRATPTSA